MLEPSPEALAIHRELKSALRESFFLDCKIENLRAKLQVQIGEHVGCRGVASWKWRETWLLNQALLKRHEPELFERYRERKGRSIGRYARSTMSCLTRCRVLRRFLARWSRT